MYKHARGLIRISDFAETDQETETYLRQREDDFLTRFGVVREWPPVYRRARSQEEAVSGPMQHGGHRHGRHW